MGDGRKVGVGKASETKQHRLLSATKVISDAKQEWYLTLNGISSDANDASCKRTSQTINNRKQQHILEGEGGGRN